MRRIGEHKLAVLEGLQTSAESRNWALRAAASRTLRNDPVLARNILPFCMNPCKQSTFRGGMWDLRASEEVCRLNLNTMLRSLQLTPASARRRREHALTDVAETHSNSLGFQLQFLEISVCGCYPFFQSQWHQQFYHLESFPSTPPSTGNTDTIDTRNPFRIVQVGLHDRHERTADSD